MVRNKDKTKTPSLILPLLLMIKFSPSLLIPAPHWKWHRGGLQWAHDESSLLLSPTHTFPLLQYGVPPHKIQSSWTAPVCVPHSLQKTCPWQKTCSRVGSSPWAAAPAKTLLRCEPFTAGGSFRIPPPLHTSSVGFLVGCTVDAWLHCSPLHLLICSSALPPSLSLVFTELFLTYFSNSSLSKLQCSIFWPFLTAFPKMSLFSCGAQLWDLALPCSESGTQQPQASSQMSPLKPLPSTHYQNVDMWTQHIFLKFSSCHIKLAQEEWELFLFSLVINSLWKMS